MRNNFSDVFLSEPIYEDYTGVITLSLQKRKGERSRETSPFVPGSNPSNPIEDELLCKCYKDDRYKRVNSYKNKGIIENPRRKASTSIA